MELIKIKNLNKKFKNKTIYKEVNLVIEKSEELITFWGESGCGKTTLLNIIMGYDQDYTGDVEVLGKNLKKMSLREYADFLDQNIAIVYQDFKLFENLTICDNLKLITSDLKEINKYLKLFKLEGLENKKVKNISGGQKQRVAIIRAIIKRPQLLILDEPTSSLDSSTFNELIKILEQLKKQMQILIVTHDAKFRNYTKEMLVVDKGNIQINYIEELNKDRLDSINNDFLKDNTYFNTHLNDSSESYNTFPKDSSLKNTIRLIKNQKFNYFIKITLLILFIGIFLVIFNGVYNRVQSSISRFYAGLESNVIILNIQNIKELYEYEENYFLTPNDKFYWSEIDVSNVQEIPGVKEVYLIDQNTSLAIKNQFLDKEGYESNMSYQPEFYPSVIAMKPSSFKSNIGTIYFDFKRMQEPENLLQYYKTPNVSKIKILAGNYPKDKTQDVLIPDFMADQILLDTKYTSYEGIINTNIKLDVIKKDKQTTKQYRISGIYNTDYEFNLENEYSIYLPFQEYPVSIIQIMNLI